MLPLYAIPVHAAMPTGYVSVRSYGAVGDGRTDDSTAVQRAMNSSLNVWFPPGVYLVGNLRLRSGHKLGGEGASSILRQKIGAKWCMSANPGMDGSSDPSRNMTNIGLTNLRFEGQAGNVPFDEHIHLLNLNAVTGVDIVGCSFVKFVADGIYLGSSNYLNVERHNFDVTIRDCIFDGVVKNNRNCISIIDGTDIVIDNCKFTRAGRRDQPAAIDVEPNGGSADSFTRLERITISRCTFWDLHSIAHIGLILRPNDLLGHPSNTFRIENCRFVGTGTISQYGLEVTQSSLGSKVNPTSNTTPLNLTVTGCSFEGVYRPFSFTAVKGVIIENTTFYNSPTYAFMGDGDGVYRNRNFTFRNCTFKHLGYDSTYGLTSMKICGIDFLTIEGCRFEDCGPSSGPYGEGLVFSGRTSSSYVTMANNTIVSVLGRTRYGIRVNASHQLYSASNEHYGTVLSGVNGNDFLPRM